MRNLIICCDGTWNTSDQTRDGIPTPTNVVRLYNAVAEKDARGNEQIKYYHPGVGTEGNWWNKLAGGAAGVGLSKNVMSAYKWLGVTYRPDDRIFLFGFSRGAYTVRSLAGMIGKCGLLTLTDLPAEKVWPAVEKAYASYRGKRSVRKKAPIARIHFLGVWDTVGALGIPDDMAILDLLDNPKRYAFHDTKLGKDVINARHAVAIDEMRASFTPTLWDLGRRRKGVNQIWFPGVHSDVGGGYPETGLSDVSLGWMMDEARSTGLAFHKGMVAQLKPDPQGVLHDSRSGIYRIMRTRPRSIPRMAKSGVGKSLHDSAFTRHINPPITQAPYHPTCVLGAGKAMELSIYADQPWNMTGIYLEAGVKYRFTASGQWVDRSIKCGPGGGRDGDFDLGELAHMLGTLWGKMEQAWKKMTNNEKADFRGSKRHEEYPWFCLVGAVAGATQEIFKIGDGCDFAPKKSGYLHCFANDAWGFYGNNKGSVTLKIERLSTRAPRRGSSRRRPG